MSGSCQGIFAAEVACTLESKLEWCGNEAMVQDSVTGKCNMGDEREISATRVMSPTRSSGTRVMSLTRSSGKCGVFKEKQPSRLVFYNPQPLPVPFLRLGRTAYKLSRFLELPNV